MAPQEGVRSGSTPETTVTIEPDFFEGIPGSEIGPYRLVRQIAEGGMGIVYHAQQTQPIRRDVALKIIKPGMDSKQVIARFETERQALALMEHDHIARVFDAGTTAAGRPYFVMELVDGAPITRYCDSKRLNLRERIELFIPVCHAIQHAHQKGIIHRDIKPSNILIADRDGAPTPKVIDFGLAKALGHQLGGATLLTNLGTVVGTLQYMSPEQAELGRHDIDTRSDVYSLGAVLYELLAGTTPLERQSLAKASYVELLQRIREEEPTPPSVRTRTSRPTEIAQRRRTDTERLPKLLHGELDWIVMKALEKDRARRYETVNGLTRDLQRYLEGEPVEAAPLSGAYRLRKLMRRHLVGLAVASAFVALLVAGVVVSSWMAVRASRAEQEARAVNAFLQDDLLAQASANRQARPDTKPDPNLTVRTALDRAAATIAGRFARQPLVEASIRQTIGDTYKDLGLYADAQRQVDSALSLRRRLLGEDHPDTLASMSSLSQLLYLQGNYRTMEELCGQLLEARRKVLGRKHPDTATTLNDLGVAYLMQGKYAQAEAIYVEALDIQRQALGAESNETLNTMSNLASVYSTEGKNAKAEPLFSTVLEIRRRREGEEHPDTLVGLNNLAITYKREGKLEQAEPLYRQAVEIQRRVLGPEHPDTLTSMNNLASLYRTEGRYREEEDLRTDVLAVQRRVLGEEHPKTLTSEVGLAGLYWIQNRRGPGEALIRKALDARRRVLGPEHPDTLYTEVWLGRMKVDQKEFANAEDVLRGALKAYERTAPESWERYNCQSLLGASLAGQKKYAEAESLLRSGYEGLLRQASTVPSSDRPSVEAAGARIAALYENWGKSEKAAEWRQNLPRPQAPGR